MSLFAHISNHNSKRLDASITMMEIFLNYIHSSLFIALTLASSSVFTRTVRYPYCDFFRDILLQQHSVSCDATTLPKTYTRMPIFMLSFIFRTNCFSPFETGIKNSSQYSATLFQHQHNQINPPNQK